MGIAYPPTNIGASGGSPPYTWSGTPPAGFNLTGGGTVSGTPTDTGAPFTVQVSDSKGQSATASTSIPIAPALAVTSLRCVNGCSVEQNCVVCGTYVAYAGGVGTPQLVNYSPLPPGTTPGVPSLAGGFTGLSPTGGPFQFNGDIVDSLGATQKVQASFLVFPHVTLGNGQVCCNGGPSRGQLPLSGGDGKVTNVTFQNLPNGLDGNPVKVSWSVTTPGFLDIQVNSTYSTSPSVPPPFAVTVFDGSPCGSGFNCNATATVTFNAG